MKKKIALIGIDSLDPTILLKYRNILPTFSQIIDQSPTLVSKSVFPVDTIPAWYSIFSGQNPSNHGVLYSYDIFDPNLSNLTKIRTDHLNGKLFWDYAENAEKRSIIIFPLLKYPATQINGIMICRNPLEKRIDWIHTRTEVSCYPNTMIDKFQIPNSISNIWGGYPGEKNLKKWIHEGEKILNEEIDLGLEICRREKWDLFFIYHSILDIIQHRLWRYFDKNDPQYHRNNKFETVILNFYKIFDSMLNNYLKILDDTPMFIVSDHGHKSRPIITININEYLRKMNYLSIIRKQQKIISKLKKNILNIVQILNLESEAIKLLIRNPQFAPIGEKIYSSSILINDSKTLAQLSNFAGIKSYNYGGIKINDNLLSSQERTLLKKILIEKLSTLKYDNQPIFNFIKSREDLYHGKYNDVLYPEIVFELKNELAVGWDLQSNLVGKAYDHKVSSGGHSKNATLLMKNIDKKIMKIDPHIEDICPTILSILDVFPKTNDFDGADLLNE